MAALINLLDPFRKVIRQPSSFAGRKLIFDIHLWCGLATALYIIAISVSGSILVFRTELDSLLEPSPPVSVGAMRERFSILIKNVEGAFPHHHVTGIINVQEPNLPITVYAADAKQDYIAVQVDPYSGKPLGLKSENSALKFVQDLHFNLLAGRAGRQFNSLGGLILCLTACSGLLLWWRGTKNWRNGLMFNFSSLPTSLWTSRRLNFELHSVIGFWALPLILIWGVSAIYFGFRSEFIGALNIVFPVSSQVRAISTTAASPDDRPPLSIDDLVAAARLKVPGQWLARIALANGGKRITQIWLTDQKSYRKDENTEVDVDICSGAVTNISVPAHRLPGDFILDWLSKLHFGTFGGIFIKALWAVLGLTPAFLSITGMTMFWQRTQKKLPKPAPVLPQDQPSEAAPVPR